MHIELQKLGFESCRLKSRIGIHGTAAMVRKDMYAWSPSEPLGFADVRTPYNWQNFLEGAARLYYRLL
jgi:hypothetical protein